MDPTAVTRFTVMGLLLRAQFIMDDEVVIRLSETIEPPAPHVRKRYNWRQG